MRLMLLFLVMLLGGCFAVQPIHNPMKKAKVAKSEESAIPTAVPSISPDPTPVPPRLCLSKVEMMREMYLMQRQISSQILKMAEELSPNELSEFNKWLSQYGQQIQKKVEPNTGPKRVF